MTDAPTWQDRQQAAEAVRTRGTASRPRPPRDLQWQPGSRGGLLTWALPDKFDDVRRFRVYKDTESSLYDQTSDRAIRQMKIQLSSGAVPQTFALFVSSVNGMGAESQKVQIMASALAEASAPQDPETPPEFGTTNGADTSVFDRSIRLGRGDGLLER